jgi:tRNA dimethylallyltransferase
LKHLIVVAGPTASGKTALAIQLANHYQTEIISCDSRQVFQEMEIGTAKPSKEELSQVKHHFIDSHSIYDVFSAGDFERQGLELLNALFLEYDTVIMVGGSGLYVRALCHGLDDFPEIDASYRVQLNQEFEQFGLTVLQEELRIKDPEYFAKLDIENSQRVIRALEICRGTGRSISSFRTNNEAKRNFKITKVGVQLDRQVLYDRINRRVDLMMEAGLLEEVKSLYSKRELNALQTVGYSEFFDFLDAKISLDEAVNLVKQNTRNYAKRQITWFNKESNLTWMDTSDFQNLLNHLKSSS